MSTLSELLPAGGGGAWTLVSTTSVSSASTIDITSLTAYKRYKIVFDITASSSHYMKWTMKLNGSWRTTYYKFYTDRWISADGSAAVLTSSNSSWGLAGMNYYNEISNAAPIIYEFTLETPTISTYQNISWQGISGVQGFGGLVSKMRGIGTNSSYSGVLQGFRIAPSTGTYSGVFHIYGLTATEI
tara:strand:- start:630 stop:1187 length:558 start_codon:yes stop_codon:yes gene_type:complete